MQVAPLWTCSSRAAWLPALLVLALLTGCAPLPNSERDPEVERRDAAAEDGEMEPEEDAAPADARAGDARTLDADDKGSDGGKMQSEPEDGGQDASEDGGDASSSGPCASGQVQDCMGVCGGSAVLDDCMVCNGRNASKDCMGVCGGSAREDCSGVCNGPNQPLTYYADSDGDNLGDPKMSRALCAAEAGMVTNSDDCDDTRKGVCTPSDVLRFKRKLPFVAATPALSWASLPMVGLGDVDGDKVPDLAIASPSPSVAPNSSVMIVFLNANGSVKGSRRLTTADFGAPNPVLSTGLGASLAALGDIDGDMIPDLAVGEPNPAPGSLTDFGRVWLLFLKRDGSVGFRAIIPSPAISIVPGYCQDVPMRWGDKLASFDLDRDGRLELAVGTERDCRNTSQRVTGRIETYRLAAARTAALINRVSWDAAPYGEKDFLDATLSAAGDADGDGVGDLTVVTTLGTGAAATGSMWTLMLAANGSVKGSARLTATSAGNPALASMTRTFGALPGSTPRVLLNLPSLTTRGGFAAARAPSSSSTTPAYRVFYPREMGLEAQVVANTSFGQSGTSLGDLEQDGLPELLVTAPQDVTGGAGSGAAYVLGFAATCDNQTLRGDCNATAADGCETTLNTADNCGACGLSCTGNPNSTGGACSAQGRCTLECSPNFGDCNGDPRDGCETDLRTSVQHCGMCGNTCQTVKHMLPKCSANTCSNDVSLCEPFWNNCNANATDGCEACGKCGQQSAAGAPAGTAPPAAPCLQDQVCRRQMWRATNSQTGDFEYAMCVTQCPVGRGDCNGLASDGCEANLTLQTRCGSCSANATCGVWGWLEYCVLNEAGTQYQCTN